MKKAIFKKILLLLDEVEHDGIQVDEAKKLIYQDMKNNNFPITKNDIHRIFALLFQHQCIKSFRLGIDLGAVTTVYARSNLNSDIEALASFEMFIKDHKIMNHYLQLLEDENWYSEEIMIDLLGNDLFEIQRQTSLYDVSNKQYRFRISLRSSLFKIIKEYQERESFYISSTLLARFAVSIVPTLQQSDYRNGDRSMVNYDYQKEILSIIPKRGIPSNRDVTKSLQTFYKDTLFHEFDHQCPICEIHIAHMLIASHIKPFRDCAHIYEPIDHNNGLLLCRNHDYLFDQGYFSFLDDGSLLLSNELLSHHPFDAFHIKKDYVLPKRYLSKERKAFLKYHRKNIFKQ